MVTEGTAEGRILTEKRGPGTFGYDPVFYFPPLGRTFAELTPEEKESVSHRGNALRRLAVLLRGEGPGPVPGRTGASDF
ncbi:MAG: non-canonical purine NTP pyrophosphatase [Clostridia bacterium]|nr:non-canonical purine NTP pyrophosphatase [Clostridia bacterium]